MQDITGRNNIYRLSKTPSAEKYSTELWEAVAINDYVGAYFYVYSSVDISGAIIQIVHSDDGDDWYPAQDYETVKRGFANAGHGYAVGYLGTKPYIRLRTSSDVSMDAYLVWLPTSWPSSVTVLQGESVPGAGSPPPPLGECPECPTCPTCPECGKCPPCNCPDCPPAAPCPDCPICPPLQSCPICPECPPQEDCPICPSCPECPPQIECPACPEVPDTSNVLTVAQVSLLEAGTQLVRLDYNGNIINTTPDFDAHPIYASITEVEIDGNIMIGIPKFYFRRGCTKYIDAWSISDRPLSGYDVHPAFLYEQDAGREVDRVYIGKYQGRYGANIHGVDAILSRDVSSPPNSGTLADMEFYALAHNKMGVLGYHMLNIHEWALIGLLAIIEYATLDLVPIIGAGYSNKPSGTPTAAVNNPEVMSSQYRGITGILGNNYAWLGGIMWSNTWLQLQKNNTWETIEITCNTGTSSPFITRCLNLKTDIMNLSHLFYPDYTLIRNVAGQPCAYRNGWGGIVNQSSSKGVVASTDVVGKASTYGLLGFTITSSTARYICRIAKWPAPLEAL